MPPSAMGGRRWSRCRSGAWGVVPLSLLLRGGRVEDGGAVGVLAGRAEAPHGELGLDLGFGFRCRASGHGEACRLSVNGDGITSGERAWRQWQN